jgi:GNAT superfamily N-acetyltransferase
MLVTPGVCRRSVAGAYRVTATGKSSYPADPAIDDARSEPAAMTTVLGTLDAADDDRVAALLQRSLYAWYENRLGQGARFGTDQTPYRIFPRVYRRLDPGEEIAARDASGRLVGVCFVHPRETHHAIGIVATDPDIAGRGVARAMMEEALGRADRAGRPVRLVSSLLNLESFSLYSRLGFTPRTIYQDLEVHVPATGMPGPPPNGTSSVRSAVPADASPLADLEHMLSGIRRLPDHEFFLSADSGYRVWLAADPRGRPTGFLAASHQPEFPMLGPGVAIDESIALALAWRALDALRGRTIVFLAPATARGLVQRAYGWGARNVELHVAQARGETPVGTGIAFPTFLPESG